MELISINNDIESKDNIFYLLLNYKGKVLYGIPKETNGNRKDKDGLGNADILAINENGSMVNNIPARPLLIPVAEKHEKQIDVYMDKIIDALLSGNEEEADKLMKELAFRMETWTKAYFRAQDKNPAWAPNSELTVKGGWIKNKKTGKPVYVKGKKSSQPLIDTGELRQAIRGVFDKN